MDIYRERFRALLKRFRLQASTTDPGRLFLSHMIRSEKSIYLYGLRFAVSERKACMSACLVGVELHLVN